MRTAPTATSVLYRRLPPEPWGRRFARARDDVAGLKLAEAALLVSEYMRADASSVCRLEALDEEPIGPRSQARRELAYLLCAYVYHIDPAEFGLRDNDVPPALRVRRRLPTGRWVTAPRHRSLELVRAA